MAAFAESVFVKLHKNDYSSHKPSFLCSKTNYQKPGKGGGGLKLVGIGIDRDMKKWSSQKQSNYCG